MHLPLHFLSRQESLFSHRPSPFLQSKQLSSSVIRFSCLHSMTPSHLKKDGRQQNSVRVSLPNVVLYKLVHMYINWCISKVSSRSHFILFLDVNFLYDSALNVLKVIFPAVKDKVTVSPSCSHKKPPFLQTLPHETKLGWHILLQK